MPDIQNDVRIDPRIKAILSFMPNLGSTDVSSRQEILDELASPDAGVAAGAYKQLVDLMDSEEIAPSKGLTIRTEQIVSQPDGNLINLLIIRPDNNDVLPCIYYIHGGGMAYQSAFDGNYRAWGKILAAKNVAVVMVDFRNALQPSSSEGVAPVPAGLNDCISGLKWTSQNASSLHIDASKIVVAGESGGGNLTLATGLALKKEARLDLIKGLYALCPYIVGYGSEDKYPSRIENSGIFIYTNDNRGIHGYGISEFENKNPLAWPAFASVADVTGFPPTVISVNECDPLRDEGIGFYRLLLSAGVSARARMVLGTMHATELIPIACPEITHDTADHLVNFAKS
ncbi:MAG: alpha/beta hydrolase fold domain-containing protein [Acidimicrobiaceae bacterium]